MELHSLSWSFDEGDGERSLTHHTKMMQNLQYRCSIELRSGDTDSQNIQRSSSKTSERFCTGNGGGVIIDKIQAIRMFYERFREKIKVIRENNFGMICGENSI